VGPLTESLVRGLPPIRGGGSPDTARLEPVLVQLLERAHSEWPDVALDTNVFLQHAGERLSADGDLVESLQALRAADLYLACACAQGDGKAIAHLRRLLAGVEEALRRLQKADWAGDEIESRVLEHVLVAGGDRPPRIAEYSGRGSLRGWLQVAATRLMLTSMRGGTKVSSDDDDGVLLDIPSQATSPELQALKNRYRSDFNEAFREAIRTLSPRDRNVLRQHYLDGLTTEELATLYRVNRATAVRWLAAAREGLLTATRDAAVNRLGVRPEDFQSLFDVVRSQLDVSLPIVFSRRT
jgi:RNA polymerase sigma-70 factor, ECF subfamily